MVQQTNEKGKQISNEASKGSERLCVQIEFHGRANDPVTVTYFEGDKEVAEKKFPNVSSKLRFFFDKAAMAAGKVELEAKEENSNPSEPTDESKEQGEEVSNEV